MLYALEVLSPSQNLPNHYFCRSSASWSPLNHYVCRSNASWKHLEHLFLSIQRLLEPSRTPFWSIHRLLEPSKPIASWLQRRCTNQKIMPRAPGGVGSTKLMLWRPPGGVGSTKIMFWRAPGSVHPGDNFSRRAGKLPGGSRPRVFKIQ